MPKLRFENARKLILTVILASFIFGGGYAFGISGFYLNYNKYPIVTVTRITPPERELDFSLFWEVWDRLEASYIDRDDIKESELVYGAIRGMVASVGDPYTAFLAPRENKVIREDLQGSFEGVGIQIGFKDGNLAIIAPLADTPAEQAGIRAGDFVLEIKDEAKGISTSTLGMSLPEAVKLIRGESGTKVTLVIGREGENETLDVEITRASIDVPSVILEFLDSGNGTIAQVKVSRFGFETTREWREAVREILNKGVVGVILDVRNNPGGSMQASVDIASEFLNGGTVVIEEDSRGRQNKYKATGRSQLLSVPVVILVNEGSASASEILAGALRDRERGTIVGEITFGKGSVQEPQQLKNGSSLHVTVSRWLTPNGTSVDEGGLVPDIEVVDDPETEEDEQLQEAIRLLSE